MIFLIEYDRRQGSLIKFERFQDSRKSLAEASRLDIELKLGNQSSNREVVLLEAIDETAHRRYFEDITQISKSVFNNRF